MNQNHQPLNRTLKDAPADKLKTDRFAKILKPVKLDLIKETRNSNLKHIIQKYEERFYDLIYRIHLSSSAQHKSGKFVPLNAHRMQKLYGKVRVVKAETDDNKIIYFPQAKLKIENDPAKKKNDFSISLSKQSNNKSNISNLNIKDTNNNNKRKTKERRYTYVRNISDEDTTYQVKKYTKKTMYLYYFFLDFLKSKKWIISRNDYVVGSQTKRYKLTAAFMKKYPRESWNQIILTDKTLIKNRKENHMNRQTTQKIITEEVLHNPETPEIIRNQIRLLTSGRLTIKKEEVIDLLFSLYYENGENKAALRSWIDAVENYFRERNIWIKQDSAGRLYNNITNLKSEIRRLILIDGERTTEVDWGSAHPSILAHFLLILWNKSDDETECFLNKIVAAAYNLDEEPFDMSDKEAESNNDEEPFDMSDKEAEARQLNTDEELDDDDRKIRFLKDLDAGTMKENLFNHLKNIYPDITKDESKMMLNAAINRHLFTEMKDKDMSYNHITDFYGNIFRPLEMMKIITEQQNQKKSWNIVSKIFLNIESRVMKQVLAKLNENGITAAIWIHDGILIKQSDANRTQEIMEEILNNNLFLRQTAKIK